MQLWDAIVVGAGPAGCAAAYDLAAAGRQVLLVDKASFPRPKACAGALTMKAVRALRYAIDPVVRKTVCDAVLEHRSGPGELQPVRRRRPICVMTVRSELDAYCLDQTRARGAGFLRIGGIAAIEEQADRVLLRMEGQAEPLTARFVVGADGVHSRVRALQEGSSTRTTTWFRKAFAVEANVPYASTGREFPFTFDFAPVLGGYGWLFPRNDHVNVGLYTCGPAPLPKQGGLKEGQSVIDRAALADYIAARCGTRDHGAVTGQFLGLGAARYVPSQGRVLLAGDAAGFVDPLTGEGIYGAIASGQAAAAAILASLHEGSDAAGEYRARLRGQCADLRVSEMAAAKFYAEPERGFRLIRMPLVRRAVLHAYSQGGSLTLLARGIGLARRLAS